MSPGFRCVFLLPMLVACSPGNEGLALSANAGAGKRPEIPSHYHGLWANHIGLCGHGGDRGQRILIGRHSVDHMSVRSVDVPEGNGPILVHLKDDEGELWMLSLNLGSKGRGLRVQSEATGFDVELVRCPESGSRRAPRTSASANADGQD